MNNETHLVAQALRRAGISDDVDAIADKIVGHLLPEVVEVEKTETRLVLDITSSVDAGLFCAITTGNPKIEDYTYPCGKQSGLVRFGQCDRLVAEALGETLLSIVEIAFTRQVSIGETVRLTITQESKEENEKLRGTITTNTITGIIKSNGKTMMKPSTVLTYRPFE